ncbi:MAG: class I SAM-dependent methyltransferase [Ancrocorticia sp.]
MTSSRSASFSPTLLLDDDVIARLRDDLTAAEWTVTAVEERLSPMALAAMKRDQFTPASMELESDPSPAAVLTRLFMLAASVESDAVEQALPTLTVDGAIKLGLIARAEQRGSVERDTAEGDIAEGDAASTGVTETATAGASATRTQHSTVLRAAVDLRPYEGKFPEISETKRVSSDAELHWWVASDLSQAQTGEPPREDFVLGIASASNSLARLTLRDSVDSALDLGCGCGILALQLTSHAKRVVATDISERACNFTRFNALLNEAPIDVRQGSFFEPVEGERFDLITSNPPFVITPQAVRADSNLEYRDGGMDRDHLIPLVIEQAVAHLAPGGTLQMLANWEVKGNEFEWATRPRQWVEKAAEPALTAGQPVDAWLVQRDLLDISQYAEWWIRDARGVRVSPENWNAEYREWLSDFTAAGTKFVGLGSLALRVGVPQASPVSDAPAIDEIPLSPFGLDETGVANLSGGSDSTLSSAVPSLTQSPAAHLNIICEYLPEGRAIDALAVRTALDNLSLPSSWESIPLVCAPDVREARYFVPGSSDPELIQITQGRAGGRERSVTPAVAALIGVSDGDLAPAQVIPAIAMLLEQDEEQTRAELESALPELLRSGVVQFQPTVE